MATESKKQNEERYARNLLDGMVNYKSLDACECPDFWVRCGSLPDIALEVTEYHPQAQGAPDVRRTAVESRWGKIEKILDRERRARPSLQHIHLRLNFKDKGLPRQNEHQAFAFELIRLVEEVAAKSVHPDHEIKIAFLPKSSFASLGGKLGGFDFFAEEDWPQVSKQLSGLHISYNPELPWLPWCCMNVAGAWVGPEEVEFLRIFNTKAAKAPSYNLQGSPLWLLVVCNLFHDLQSHIFPQDDDDLATLLAQLGELGFDFENGPFNQVWLLSAAGKNRLRLHPRAEVPL
jgi:hypothetical protein